MINKTARQNLNTIVTRLCENIQTIGTDAFSTQFDALIFDGFDIGEFLIFYRPGPKTAPVVLSSRNRANGSSCARAHAYCQRFWRDDPIYHQLDDGNSDGTYTIRLRAKEIRHAVFRNTCYSRPGFAEKMTLAQKSKGETIALSLFSNEHTGGFDPRQIAQLTQFGQLLLPILSLHYRVTGDTTRSKQVSSLEMEICVAGTFPELTKRETAVCARSILGVTAEGIALDLGIKQTSVLTYRRRAYARLNINSINQLSTMLIQSSAARQLAVAS